MGSTQGTPQSARNMHTKFYTYQSRFKVWLLWETFSM